MLWLELLPEVGDALRRERDYIGVDAEEAGGLDRKTFA